jgi:glutathione synthase/RimK-type ligase-like ATP-grasp enzyme
MRSDPHVLIVSTILDSSTDAVVAALGSKGCRVTRVNTETLPFGATIGFAIDEASTSVAFGPEVGVHPDHHDYSAVWYRRIRVPEKPAEMHEGIYDFCLRESRSALLGSILALGGRVMSPPASVWAAEYKPYQLAAARAVGMHVPATLITNDPTQIRAAFHRFNGKMVAKPVRTGFVDLGSEQRAIFTNAVAERDLDDLRSATLSPAIFQQLVPKKCDVRVTVVGRRMFVAEIDSQTDEAAKIDWRRTNNPKLPHRRGELPSGLRERVLALMDRLCLSFGALDFVRSADGDDYFFLEINPNGQWLWLDDMLGFDITGSVADWLTEERQT